ncbi:hypothetical protein D1BOALGB6SA_4239 [Olavius sp. associated proteobacterium Delta 1]|nr:hypothetical protein D1BOALGB6SA_4239 [Olavius sp. associated proteobacterium Delta 1]
MIRMSRGFRYLLRYSEQENDEPLLSTRDGIIEKAIIK